MNVLQDKCDACAIELQTHFIGKPPNTELGTAIISESLKTIVAASDQTEKDKSIGHIQGYLQGYLRAIFNKTGQGAPNASVDQNTILTIIQKHFTI